MGDYVYLDTASSHSLPQNARRRLQGRAAVPQSESGARPHLCHADHGCGKAFTRKADLERHLLVVGANWAHVCPWCKGRRKCYIFARKEHFCSHVRHVHKQVVTPQDAKEYWRHLTDEEEEDFRNSRHHRPSSNGAGASSHLSPLSAAPSQALSSASSDVSRSLEPSVSFAKRSRPSTPPGPALLTGVRDLEIRHGEGSGESASKRARHPDRRDEVIASLGAEASIPEFESAQRHAADVRLLSLFDHAHISSAHMRRNRSLKWFERVWDDARWGSLSSSSSRSSRSSHPSMRNVKFQAPPSRSQGSSGGSQMKPHGHIPGSVQAYLTKPPAEDHWNHLQAPSQGTHSQPEHIDLTGDDSEVDGNN